MATDNFSAANADPELLSALVSRPACTVLYEPLKASLEFDYAVNISTLGSIITLKSASEHGFLARAEMEITDRLELHFVEQGHYHSETGHENVAAQAGHAFLLRNVDEHRIISQPGTRQTCVAIPIDRIARLFALDVDDPVAALAGLEPIADLRNGALNYLHRMTALLCNTHVGEHPLAAAPLGASLLEEAFLSVFMESWPKIALRELVYMPTPRHVRRAVDWIHAHIGETIHLEDLTIASLVSIRSLQAGFKRQYGISPMAYVLRMRLSF